MRVGYARTSTVDQVAGLDAQLRDLAALGCERIFSEQLSSVDATRPQLEAALAFVREGDSFVVTKLDRLARSMRNLIEIEDVLKKKGVALVIVSPSIDTATPIGRMMLGVLAAVAQFEREIMLERQKEGVQRAKAAGKYKGRKPISPVKRQAVRDLRAQGVGASEIARQLDIGRQTVYDILNENQ
jgi:DNA invertase Pin-like site-specific DNA recombinase